MKNLTMKMMFAAATLVAAAGVASAQTLEANVPFTFRAGGTDAPGGNIPGPGGVWQLGPPDYFC